MAGAIDTFWSFHTAEKIVTKWFFESSRAGSNLEGSNSGLGNEFHGLGPLPPLLLPVLHIQPCPWEIAGRASPLT